MQKIEPSLAPLQETLKPFTIKKQLLLPFGLIGLIGAIVNEVVDGDVETSIRIRSNNVICAHYMMQQKNNVEIPDGKFIAVPEVNCKRIWPSST